MPNNAETIGLQDVIEEEQTSLSEQAVDTFQSRLQESIKTGLEQVAEGKTVPFDEAYKNRLRNRL